VDVNGNKCLRQWDFKICKRIGVLTKEEAEKFENELNLNWLKKYAKKCPNCL
jgi:hypothetical protein